MSLSKHQQKLYKKEKEMKAKLAAGQTPEERKAAREAAAAGAQAFKCLLCMQTFSVSQGKANPPVALVDHANTKHPKNAIPECFKHLNSDGTKVVDDTAEKDGASKKKKKAGNKKGGGKGGAVGSGMPPELLAAMAKKKKKKKKPAETGIKGAQAEATKKVTKMTKAEWDACQQ